jgi:RNA polymerase sigma-70 factor (ECF subfamily)
LLHNSRGRIFGYIYSLVHNQADTEDLFQETVVQLWKKFDEFDPEGDFGRWATRFAHYTVLNFIRVNSRRRTFFSKELLEQFAKVHQREDTESYMTRTEALNHCFERLPKADQQLVESCYTGGRTMKEVAGEKRRTVNAIYQAMSRIRRALLLCIEKTIARSAADG